MLYVSGKLFLAINFNWKQDHAAATILITAHAPLLPSHTPRRISPFSRPLSIPDAPHIVRQKSDLSTTKSVLETPANSPGLLEGATGILDGEDEDMNRAKELLRLHGMRAQLDGGGAGGLVSDARRTVDEIERRYRKRLDNAFRH